MHLRSDAADQPIVLANQAFCDLIGYEESDFLGKNCHFLQGPETTAESVRAIRQALENNEVTTVEVINYRKNVEMFVNALQLGPVFDDDGELIFHFGSQLDVAPQVCLIQEKRTSRQMPRLPEVQTLSGDPSDVIRFYRFK